MVNLLGLCKNLRDNFPIPTSPTEIRRAIIKYLGHEAPLDTRMDITKALSSKWKRDGWFWDSYGAVRLDRDETAFFHQHGVSIIRDHEFAPGVVLLKLIKHEERHPRVVWF